MPARLIDGKALSVQLRDAIASQTVALAKRAVQPGLAVIIVGHNPASEVYVANKVKACADVGFYSKLDRFEATLTEAQLLARIDELNRDDKIDGILVQLPLPAHIDAQRVIESISPSKDVDGFHVASAGALMVGRSGFKSCTPYGCMKLIESTGERIAGKDAVVIGRSNIVGKPMALMLLAANATVTICHSATRNLDERVRQADIVVAAVGKVDTVTAGMIKPGAIVIDVGMNRIPPGRPNAGKLCGDVDFDAVRQVAGWITPVPGGVGPMTITMLLQNTLESATRRASARPLPSQPSTFTTGLTL